LMAILGQVYPERNLTALKILIGCSTSKY